MTSKPVYLWASQLTPSGISPVPSEAVCQFYTQKHSGVITQHPPELEVPETKPYPPAPSAPPVHSNINALLFAPFLGPDSSQMDGN